MLCERCGKEIATVHLTQNFFDEGGAVRAEKRDFCPKCVDGYFAETPGMNSARDLIQLSERYRSELYDLLEVEHPEALRAQDVELHKAARVMERFLREQLKKNGVELNDDGFGMVFGSFIGTAEWYERCRRFRGE